MTEWIHGDWVVMENYETYVWEIQKPYGTMWYKVYRAPEYGGRFRWYLRSETDMLRRCEINVSFETAEEAMRNVEYTHTYL